MNELVTRLSGKQKVMLSRIAHVKEKLDQGVTEKLKGNLYRFRKSSILLSMPD